MIAPSTLATLGRLTIAGAAVFALCCLGRAIAAYAKDVPDAARSDRRGW